MIIPVNCENGNYDIILENGAISRLSHFLNLDRKVLVVTDDGAPYGYSEKVCAQAKESYLEILPQGEGTKNLDSFKFLLSKMAKYGFTRGDAVIAVGGGVIGDLAGFVASAYMRGVDFYNIPTTLLSMVDSSIGGKVAVDLDGVKNIVGAFYQPKRVVIDPEVLNTLDDRQFLAGLSESIKMAATMDVELFEIIENGNAREKIEEIIRRSLLLKKAVVEADPKEKGLRKVLNFGHTLGHAVESLYMGKLLHGECVAIGTLACCSKKVRERLFSLYEKLGLPTKVDLDGEKLLSYLKNDKKSVDGGVVTVFVEEIGSFEFRTESYESLLGRI